MNNDHYNVMNHYFAAAVAIQFPENFEMDKSS